MFQPLSRVCCGLLSALLVLAAPAAEAAPKKSAKSSKSSRTRASKPAAAEPAAQPAAEPAPAEPAPAEPAPAAEAKAAPAPAAETKVAEAPSRPARESKAETRAAPAQKSSASRSAAAKEAPLVSGPMRIGLSPDLYLEGAKMSGVQFINSTRLDESFDYSAGFLSITAWVNTPVPTVSERLRLGAGLRIFGNYAASGGQQFGFGIYNELFASGEYGLPVADKMEVVFAARAGLSLLIPGLEFAETISRLQTQGVAVWSVPRVGWLLGPSVGARRRMSDRSEERV